MVNREQKIKRIREIVKNNPTDTSKQHIEQAKKEKVSIRKTDFLKERREVLKLPEPSKAKRESSIPVKHRTAKQKASIQARVRATKKKPVKRKPIQLKLPKLPFEQTKFGKIVRDLQKVRNITEKKAIIHARKLLKIDKSDYNKINQKDVQILLTHTP